MRTAVLLALWDDDSTLLRQIDAERDLYVSRRCADISELLADAAVGLGQLAIIDEQLDGLDRTVIATLNSYGVPAIVLTRNDGVRWHDLGAWVAPWPGSPQRVVAEISRVLVAGTVSPQPTAAASLGDELFGLSPTAVDDGALGLSAPRPVAFNPLDVPLPTTTDGASSPLFDAVAQSQASASSPPPAPPGQLPPPPLAPEQAAFTGSAELPTPSGQLDPALALPLPPAPSFEAPVSTDLPVAQAESSAASSDLFSASSAFSAAESTAASQSPADITAAQPTTRMGRRRARRASHAASPATPSQGSAASYFTTAGQGQGGEAQASAAGTEANAAGTEASATGTQAVAQASEAQQLSDLNVDAVSSAVSGGQASIDSPPLPEGALAARVLPQSVQPVTRRSARRSQAVRPTAPAGPAAGAQTGLAGPNGALPQAGMASQLGMAPQAGMAALGEAGQMAGGGIETSPFAPPQQRVAASSDLAGSGFSAGTGMSAASAGPLASAASFASAASAAPYGSAASAAPYGSAASAAPYASAASAAMPSAASAAGGPWSAMSAAGTGWSATSAPFAASAAAPGGPIPAQTQVLASGQINGYQNPPGANNGAAQPPRRKGLRAFLARKTGANTPSAGGPVVAGPAGVPGAIPGGAPGGVRGVPGAIAGGGVVGAGVPGMPAAAMVTPPAVAPGVAAMTPAMPGAGSVPGAAPIAAAAPGSVAPGAMPGAGRPVMPGAVPGAGPLAGVTSGAGPLAGGPAMPGAPGAVMPGATPGGQGAYAPNGQRGANTPAGGTGAPTRRSKRAAFSAASAAGAGAAGAGAAGAAGALAAASSQNNAAPLNTAATTHSAQPEVKLGWPVTAGTPSSPATSAFAPASHREEIDAAKPKIGKIIAVWGTHGAPGRSTLALALAAYLNEQGSTILVDCDINAPAQVQLLGLPEDSSGLASAARLATHGELDSTRLVQTLLSAKADLQVLTGLGRSGRWRELPVASMNKVWEVCRHTAEYTVVDLSGGLEEERVEDFAMEPDHDAVAAALLEQADLTLIVGAADPVGIRRLIQLLNSNRQAVGGRSQVVVNRVRSSTAGADPNSAIGSVLARYTSASDIVYVPADYRLFDKALMQAQPVAVVESRSAAAKSIAKLAKLVMTQLA